MNDQPITPAWLTANGWRITHRKGEQGEYGWFPNDHYRRDIAHETTDGRRPFVSLDDLAIELAAWSFAVGEWGCWVAKENRAWVFVRLLRTVGDVVKLYEGLTGREFTPKQV